VNSAPANKSDEPQLPTETTGKPAAFGVIDILQALAQDWKLLVFGPIVGALAALWFASTRPVTYVSTTTLLMNEAVARAAESLMLSPAVLDATITAHPDLPGESVQQKRRYLTKAIQWSVTPGETRKTANLFYMTVEDQSPARAQSIAKSQLDRWIDIIKPRPDAKSRMEFELQRTELRLREADAMFERLNSEAKSVVSPNSQQGELATSIEKLRENRFTLFQQAQKLRLDLMGGSRDAILSPPDLPSERVSPTRNIVWPLSAAAATLSLLLLLLLVRLLVRANLARLGRTTLITRSSHA
jgi:uncharacterized protein involved in exopolysaccharide biosynthesis